MSTGEHCVTETESCFQTCGNSFIGVLDDNVINATREETEAQCRKVRIMIVRTPSLISFCQGVQSNGGLFFLHLLH